MNDNPDLSSITAAIHGKVHHCRIMNQTDEGNKTRVPAIRYGYIPVVLPDKNIPYFLNFSPEALDIPLTLCYHYTIGMKRLFISS